MSNEFKSNGISREDLRQKLSDLIGQGAVGTEAYVDNLNGAPVCLLGHAMHESMSSDVYDEWVEHRTFGDVEYTLGITSQSRTTVENHNDNGDPHLALLALMDAIEAGPEHDPRA